MINIRKSFTRKEIAHRYYQKHKIDILKKKKIYNKLKAKEISKQRKWYYQKNIQKFKELHKKDYQKNIKRYKQYSKNYNKTHKFQKSIYNKKYYQLNKKIINKKRNLYFNNRKKEDINFRIKSILRSAVSEKILNYSKSKRTLELLGCTVEHLRKHLESKFQEGMSWKNYGFYGWHIDHIIPCASFNLSKPKEQRKCFHYTNLQPLWWNDNFRKGSKIIENGDVEV